MHDRASSFQQHPTRVPPTKEGLPQHRRGHCRHPHPTPQDRLFQLFTPRAPPVAPSSGGCRTGSSCPATRSHEASLSNGGVWRLGRDHVSQAPAHQPKSHSTPQHPLQHPNPTHPPNPINPAHQQTRSWISSRPRLRPPPSASAWPPPAAPRRSCLLRVCGEGGDDWWIRCGLGP